MHPRWWSVYFGVVLGACLLLFLVSPMFGWWLPVLGNAGNVGAAIDRLYYFILGVTGFVFIITEAILVYNMWRFAEEPGRKAQYVHGHHHLEMAWTAVPAMVLLFIAFAQIGAWEDIKYQSKMRPPQVVMAVGARQFEWRVRYPDPATQKKITVGNEDAVEEWESKVKADADAWGANPLADLSDLNTVNEIHTYRGGVTRIYLTTRDVLHSFFLPQMRLKQDAVPGKIIPVWFKPDMHNGEYVEGKGWVYETGDDGKPLLWELTCAELCGWGHYKMRGRLFVHKDRASYERWLAAALKNARATQREKKTP